MSVFLSKPAVLCAAGRNADEFCESLKIGDVSGIVREECFGRQFFVGKVKDALSSTGDKFDSRCLRILAKCLEQIKPAAEKAKSRFEPSRIGICIGSCDNGSERSLAAHRAFFKNGEFPKDYSIEEQSAQYCADFASKFLGISGLSLAFSTACSSSASALACAKNLIGAGIFDAVVAGGVDVASPTTLLGFSSLGAISAKITNPMSRNRSGITLGEGAAFFVLSREDLDGTGIALLGAGESADASHITAPLEDGSGAARAISAALLDAKLSTEKIGYANLHATGTILNDAMESRAVSAVLGGVCASGTKPLTGHTLGAAGALELAACFLAIEKGFLPVHIWDGESDVSIPKLNLVEKSENSKIDFALSNSFAFGGCNVSLVIGRAD